MKGKALIAMAVLGILFFMVSALTDHRDVFRVQGGTLITFERMLRDLRTVGLVFVGEVHNIREHHRIELDIIRAFHEADVPLAVGLEMFRSDSQNMLDAWVRGDISPDQFQRIFADNWGRSWPLYEDIFLYAREHRIPLIGLNIPARIANDVARNGFARLPQTDKDRLPPGITCDVDNTYREFIQKAYAGHSRDRVRSFMNFCEAQLVWDKSMAWRLVEYHKMNPGRPIVVLAGVGHAWKRGIPAQVRGLSPLTSSIIMPHIPGQTDPGTVSEQDADYVVLRRRHPVSWARWDL